MKVVIQVILISLFLTSCVTNRAVRTIEVGDEDKSCPTIKAELSQLGVRFEDVKDDSGVTGKNVGLALLFWPGIIVNEVRANKNQDSIDARISHLTAIYNRKCLVDQSDTQSGNDLPSRLQELKELHDQGLIDDQEYEAARKRALEEL